MTVSAFCRAFSPPLTLFYMGRGAKWPPSWFLAGSWEMASNEPPVFCNFSWNLSVQFESKFRPGGPQGQPVHRGSLKGPRVGKIAHLVKFLDFA